MCLCLILFLGILSWVLHVGGRGDCAGLLRGFWERKTQKWENLEGLGLEISNVGSRLQCGRIYCQDWEPGEQEP